MNSKVNDLVLTEKNPPIFKSLNKFVLRKLTEKLDN